MRRSHPNGSPLLDYDFQRPGALKDHPTATPHCLSFERHVVRSGTWCVGRPFSHFDADSVFLARLSVVFGVCVDTVVDSLVAQAYLSGACFNNMVHR